MGVSRNYGYHSGGPYNEDYSSLGSILGSPYFGKLPNLKSDTARGLNPTARPASRGDSPGSRLQRGSCRHDARSPLRGVTELLVQGEHGNYHIIIGYIYWGHIGIMEKKMETTIGFRV